MVLTSLGPEKYEILEHIYIICVGDSCQLLAAYWLTGEKFSSQKLTSNEFSFSDF